MAWPPTPVAWRTLTDEGAWQAAVYGVTKSQESHKELTKHIYINATIAVNMACDLLTFSCLARHKIPGFSLSKRREMSRVCSAQPPGRSGFSP